jgi:hypothetical protein
VVPLWALSTSRTIWIVGLEKELSRKCHIYKSDLHACQVVTCMYQVSLLRNTMHLPTTKLQALEVKLHFHMLANSAKTTRWQKFGPSSTWKCVLIYPGKQKSKANKYVVGGCWSFRKGLDRLTSRTRKWTFISVDKTWIPLSCWCEPKVVMFYTKFFMLAYFYYSNLAWFS